MGSRQQQVLSGIRGSRASAGLVYRALFRESRGAETSEDVSEATQTGRPALAWSHEEF